MRYLHITEDRPATKDMTDQISKIEDLRDILERDCSEILKYYRASGDRQIFLRGIRTDKQFIHSDYWKNRKPLEMKQEIHDYTNRALTQLGLKANRENAIFTSPLEYVAEGWGDVFYVFPLNGFEYTWFTQVKGHEFKYVYDYLNDIYSEAYFEWHQAHMSAREEGTESPNRDEYIYEVFYDLLAELGPIDTELDVALDSGSEVLFTGNNGYYAITDAWKKQVREIIWG